LNHGYRLQQDSGLARLAQPQTSHMISMERMVPGGKLFFMVDRRTCKKKKSGKLNIKAPIMLDQPVLVIVPKKTTTPLKS
jgi:hypothetical protein